MLAFGKGTQNDVGGTEGRGLSNGGVNTVTVGKVAEEVKLNGSGRTERTDRGRDLGDNDLLLYGTLDKLPDTLTVKDADTVTFGNKGRTEIIEKILTRRCVHWKDILRRTANVIIIEEGAYMALVKSAENISRGTDEDVTAKMIVLIARQDLGSTDGRNGSGKGGTVHKRGVVSTTETDNGGSSLGGKMITDIITVPAEKTDIASGRLDLARLENDILGIVITTVDDDTVITGILQSAGEMLGTDHLLNEIGDGTGDNKTGTGDNLPLTPDTQTLIGMIDLQLLGMRQGVKVNTIGNHLVNSLDMIDIVSDGDMVTVLMKHDLTETILVKNSLYIGIDIGIEMTVFKNEGILDVEIHLHDMITVMKLQMIVHDIMTDSSTVTDKQTGGKGVAKISINQTLVLQLILVRMQVGDLDGNIIDSDAVLRRVRLLRIGKLPKGRSPDGGGGQVDISRTRLQGAPGARRRLLQALLEDRQRRIGTMIQNNSVILMLPQPTLQHSDIVGVRLGLGKDTTQLINIMEPDSRSKSAFIGVQPPRSMRTEIETGTIAATITTGLTEMTDVKDGEVIIRAMLNDQRPTVNIDNLGNITEDTSVKDITVTILMGKTILLKGFPNMIRRI